MAESATKLPVESQSGEPAPAAWHPFDSLRQEIDRLFEDFGAPSWFYPMRAPLFEGDRAARRQSSWILAPAVDVAETEKTYEITAELPGLDAKDVDVTTQNGSLTIRAEKREEKEEKRKDYYLSERQFGSFQRSFRLPETVEPDKIAANFKNGVLTITLPKKAEAQTPHKKIDIKAA